jgi:hypothetical protein
LTTPTIDGNWTTTNEWVDAAPPTNLGTDFVWREKWTYPEGAIYQHFLIEFFTDNTNDAGDYYEVIYDTNGDGGTAPQTDDMKVEWKGHSASGLKVYKGNGTGWAQYTELAAGAIVGADKLTASPLNSNPHWVFELTILKAGVFDISGSGYQPGIRVAVYDASNSAAGVKAWPAASTNAPSTWGQELGTLDNIPESVTVVAVVFLSSVAVIAGAYFLRKRTYAKQNLVNTGLSQSF